MTIASQVQLPLISNLDELCYPDGTPNARRIRSIVFPGVSVEKLAALLDISARTYGSWEREENKPSGAAASLLRLAAVAPDFVREVLSKHDHEDTHAGQLGMQARRAGQQKEFMAM
ncbi:helix-turn-helix domain-containing protein [Agrobacterium tumefaciens]|uniref:helix-turn-helix domain-containing protein n=1 Tax=Agrobacterium tumefaciens TaxID=358 RepID=UPI0015735819|nr:helix-turn-helix transcriptional regulator [Agrobacterium tumefaciens]NTB05941.1 helix-turn-helix transcriptional regulator [Agrobacterium tumefaciens]